MAGFVSSVLGAVPAFHRGPRPQYIDEEAAIGGGLAATQQCPRAGLFTASPLALIGQTFRLSPQSKDGRTTAPSSPNEGTETFRASFTPDSIAGSNSRSFGTWPSRNTGFAGHENVQENDGVLEGQAVYDGRPHVGPPSHTVYGTSPTSQGAWQSSTPGHHSPSLAQCRTNPSSMTATTHIKQDAAQMKPTITEAEVAQLRASLAASDAKLAQVQTEESVDTATSAQGGHNLQAQLKAMTRRAQAAEEREAATKAQLQEVMACNAALQAELLESHEEMEGCMAETAAAKSKAAELEALVTHLQQQAPTKVTDFSEDVRPAENEVAQQTAHAPVFNSPQPTAAPIASRSPAPAPAAARGPSALPHGRPEAPSPPTAPGPRAGGQSFAASGPQAAAGAAVNAAAASPKALALGPGPTVMRPGYFYPPPAHHGLAAGRAAQMPVGKVVSPPAAIAARHHAGAALNAPAAAPPPSPPPFSPTGAPIACTPASDFNGATPTYGNAQAPWFGWAQADAPKPPVLAGSLPVHISSADDLKPHNPAGGWSGAGLFQSMQQKMPAMPALKMPTLPSAGSTFQTAQRWLGKVGAAPASPQGYPTSPKTPHTGSPYGTRAASPVHLVGMV